MNEEQEGDAPKIGFCSLAIAHHFFLSSSLRIVYTVLPS
jgi:hypothetical protein